ncbi:MAG: hypothetical protein HGB14_11580 [Anaerolineaceae bacterium]|nr:hypothetical protein [Anaerolineaceae bacterium]
MSENDQNLKPNTESAGESSQSTTNGNVISKPSAEPQQNRRDGNQNRSPQQPNDQRNQNRNSQNRHGR